MSDIKFKQNSSMDPDERIEKWAPLLEGARNDCHGHMAWCLEEEARYLNSLTEEDRGRWFDTSFKYVFPVIRRVIEGFSALDRMVAMDDKDELAGVFQYQIGLTCESMVKLTGHQSDGWTAEELQGMPIFATLGGRLADYTLSYPRLN